MTHPAVELSDRHRQGAPLFTTGMVEVRDAERADRSAIRDVHVASVRGLAPDAYDDAVVDAWAGDETRDPRQYRVEGEDVAVFVAVDDGERRSLDDRMTSDDGEGVVGSENSP